MSEDLINSVKQLLELGKGDPGRLEYILDMLTTGRTLPFSDQRYLENIISFYLEGKDQFMQTKNEYTIDHMQKEIQNLNQRLAKLEKRGFERYVGKKAVFFFVTVFVGWNALTTFTAAFLNLFLPANLTPYFFPLTLTTNYFSYPLLPFVFTAILYAWVFIGLIHLVKFIRSRKISSQH